MILLCILAACSTKEQVYTEIQWQNSLSPDTFEQAEKEGKLVLLTLEANWCHWCHVMEDSTYLNAEVIQLLNEKFVCVKVDQDANPELAARYRKYGWPATIILNSKGEDLVKNAGYVNPRDFIEMLEEVVDGKTSSRKKERSAKASPVNDLRKRLRGNFDGFLDYRTGGFKSGMRYLEEESMDYALHFDASEANKKWFQKSVNAAYGLCDPEWGGVYQYSTGGDWEHPHFEKLLHIQSRYIRLFLDDYTFYGNDASLKKAAEIKAYCDRFLKQKSGLYGNAQDADQKKGEKASDYFQLADAERMKRGIPAVDTNTYTHSNADFARTLLKYYSITQDSADLNAYSAILNQLLQRKTKRGLYAHSYKWKNIDALRDNLAMAQLFTEHIKRFPSDAKIKLAMDQLVKAIVTDFRLSDGTFQGFSGDLGLQPEANIEENVPLARVFNWYAAFSGKSAYKKHAASIVAYVCKRDAAKRFFHEPAITMLLEEMDSEAQSHVSLNEGKTQPLLIRAYVFAPFYSCFQIHDDQGGKVKSKRFEGINGPSLFICTSTFCSSPLRNQKEVDGFFK